MNFFTRYQRLHAGRKVVRFWQARWETGRNRLKSGGELAGVVDLNDPFRRQVFLESFVERFKVN